MRAARRAAEAMPCGRLSDGDRHPLAPLAPDGAGRRPRRGARATRRAGRRVGPRHARGSHLCTGRAPGRDGGVPPGLARRSAGRAVAAGAGGKKLRPGLVLLVCQAVQGQLNDLARDAAVAIELVHNFSLVHDDIQDRSALRRHRPTVGISGARHRGSTSATRSSPSRSSRSCAAAARPRLASPPS